MFLISKYRADWDVGLCTTSGLAFGEPQRSGDFWEQNVFRRRKNRILPLRCGSSNASPKVVHRPRCQSPLHFDIRNIWLTQCQSDAFTHGHHSHLRIGPRGTKFWFSDRNQNGSHFYDRETNRLPIRDSHGLDNQPGPQLGSTLVFSAVPSCLFVCLGFEDPSNHWTKRMANTRWAT